jgi:hypothetical protein
MFLAWLAIVSAAIGIAMAYYVARQAGPPALWFLSAVAVMLALMSGSLSLVLAAILFARRDPARPRKAVYLSLAALSLAGGYLALV